jgi:inorganic pyrophosphatase
VLGAFVILDQGETDWKVVAVDVEDPLATKLNIIPDVEANIPGFMASLKNWFCMYKVPEGKKANTLPLGQTDKTQMSVMRKNILSTCIMAES